MWPGGFGLVGGVFVWSANERESEKREGEAQSRSSNPGAGNPRRTDPPAARCRSRRRRHHCPVRSILLLFVRVEGMV